MAPKEQALQIDLTMDSLVVNGSTGTVPDMSGNGYDGVAQGEVACVTDAVLGASLAFDGSTGFLQLPTLDIDWSQGLTIEAWVRYDAFANNSRILDLGGGAGVGNIILDNNDTLNEMAFWVFNGASPSTLSASNSLETGRWIHLAAALDASGNALLYKNGEKVGSAGGFSIPANVARASNFVGKSNWGGGDGLFRGRMARLRVYNRALSRAEILDDLEDGLSRGRFRESFPIAFELHNPLDDAPLLYSGGNLYIGGQSNQLNLVLKNVSAHSVVLKAPAATVADFAQFSSGNGAAGTSVIADLQSGATPYVGQDGTVLAAFPRGDATAFNPQGNYTAAQKTAIFAVLDKIATAAPGSCHFHLRFRPGILAANPDNEPALAVPGPGGDGASWSISTQIDSDGYASIRLLRVGGTTLAVAQTLSLQLTNLLVDGAGGARGSQVELVYRDLYHDGSSTPIVGSTIQYLSVLNHQGQKNLPVHFGFGGSNRVLNDGTAETSLHLRIKSLAQAGTAGGDGSIPLSTDPAKPTRFLISFDVQEQGEIEEWALTRAGEVAGISVKPIRRRALATGPVRRLLDSDNNCVIVTPDVGWAANDKLVLARRPITVEIEAAGTPGSYKFKTPQSLNLFENYDLYDTNGKRVNSIKTINGISEFAYFAADFPGVIDQFICLENPLCNASQYQTVSLGPTNAQIANWTPGCAEQLYDPDRQSLGSNGVAVIGSNAPTLNVPFSDSTDPAMTWSIFPYHSNRSMTPYAWGSYQAKSSDSFQVQDSAVPVAGKMVLVPRPRVFDVLGPAIAGKIWQGYEGLAQTAQDLVGATLKQVVFMDKDSYAIFKVPDTGESLTSYVQSIVDSYLSAVAWDFSAPDSSPVRVVTNKSQKALDAGGVLEFHVHGIKTSLQAGTTNLYVAYENIPGYWDGHAVLQVEKTPIIIDPQDRVGLGTATPSAKLEVNGNAVVDGDLTYTGKLLQTSDARLKTDIAPIEDAVERLAKVRGVSFRWKKDAGEQERRLGLIAQEVERVFPEVVAERGDVKSVAYQDLVPVLVEAVKELSEQVEALKKAHGEK